jgi:hypothetical protein
VAQLKGLVFKAASYLSLALLIALLALWIRSRWRWDDWQACKHSTSVEMLSGMGCIYIEFMTRAEGSYWPRHESFDSADDEEYSDIHKAVENSGYGFDEKIWAFSHRFGFARGKYFLMTESPPFWESGPMVAVQAPDWTLVLLFGILPAFKLRKILRVRSYRKRGLCPGCGYDLRATPARCPECGRSSTL